MLADEIFKQYDTEHAYVSFFIAQLSRLSGCMLCLDRICKLSNVGFALPDYW